MVARIMISGSLLIGGGGRAAAAPRVGHAGNVDQSICDAAAVALSFLRAHGEWVSQRFGFNVDPRRSGRQTREAGRHGRQAHEACRQARQEGTRGTMRGLTRSLG